MPTKYYTIININNEYKWMEETWINAIKMKHIFIACEWNETMNHEKYRPNINIVCNCGEFNNLNETVLHFFNKKDIH